MSEDLYYKTATELRRLLENRTISAVELVQSTIARTKATDDKRASLSRY